MRSTVSCVLLGALIFLSAGCAQKSARLQKSVTPPDQTLFETGANYLKRGQYIQAQLSFNTLLATYPDSDRAADAYFAMGDTFYEQGGTQNLLQAEDRYNSFLTFFPGHEKAEDAHMKIIAANAKLIQSPDRDQHYAYRELTEIDRMLRLYPKSDYAPVLRNRRIEVINHIAQGDLIVADFYQRRGNYIGAVGRLQEIRKEYPEFYELDAVLFKEAGIWEMAGNTEDAALLYAEIAEGYPFGAFFEKAKSRLVALGREVPPVDMEMAALNQSRKPKPAQGFSPMNLLVDLGKALGFVGPPDLYKEAVQIVEQEKERLAEKERMAAGEKEPPMDGDYQIEGEIRQSLSEAAAREAEAAADESVQDGKNNEQRPGRYQRRPGQ